MESSGGSGRKAKVALALLVVAALGALIYYQLFRRRDGVPELPYPDLNAERFAATCDNLTGVAFTRTVTPEDLRASAISPAPAEGAPGWTPVKIGTRFHLGSLFHVRPQGHLQMNTVGNWIVALDGEGEFILEEARTDEKRTVHTNVWNVKKGTFRAKPHDYDKGDHWLQVTVPIARVFVHKGEIGLRVSEGAGGQIWLVSGKATVVWNDGRRKELPLRGMEYL
jgi:hypothetical protein